MPIIYEPKGKAAEYSPLAMNIYRGCSHGCLYCYAPAATRRHRESFDIPELRQNFFNELDKDLAKFKGDKRPVLLSFTTDPYQPFDVEKKLARWSLQQLIKNGNAIKVLTKGGMRASRDFDLMKSGDVDFGTTLTFLDDRRSLEWEPNAALSGDRINAIRTAHSQGIKTWVSLEPVIDPESVYSIIQETHAFVNLYKVGKLNYHPIAKTIDWNQFGHKVKSLLESLGKDFYLKEDLRKLM
jgi:DNA repair photolyase